MKTGFTGTQVGMTPEQSRTVGYVLEWLGQPPLEFHHGDCVGADYEAALIARGLGWRVVGHPPDKDGKRCHFPSDEEREPLPYLERNHRIVDETELLIATPKGDEELRSGTWATMRYAAKQDRRTIVVRPNGSMEVR